MNSIDPGKVTEPSCGRNAHSDQPRSLSTALSRDEVARSSELKGMFRPYDATIWIWVGRGVSHKMLKGQD